MAESSNLLEYPCREVDLSHAAPAYAQTYAALTELVAALAAHPATPRADRPTPEIKACTKRPYFLWDFVGRTRAMLSALDPRLPDSESEGWKDVVGRSALAGRLCCKDDEMSYMMCGGDTTELTPEVKSAAAKLGGDLNF